MPVIIIDPVRDIPGGTVQTTARFRAIAMRGYSRSVRVAGAEVTFPQVVEATYTAGAWDIPPALTHLPVGDHWSIDLTDKTNWSSLHLNAILPTGDGPFDFGHLIRVTPEGEVDTSLPIWEAIRVEVAGAASAATTAATDAGQAAVDAENARLGALGYRTDAQGAATDAVTAKTDAQAAEAAAVTAKTDAQASATTATGAASTATTKALEAGTALTTLLSQKGTPNGIAALNGAGKAVDAAGNVLLDKPTADGTYVTFRDTAGNPLSARHVIITVDPATGQIADIISEAI